MYFQLFINFKRNYAVKYQLRNALVILMIISMAVTLFSQNNYTLANQVVQQPPTVGKPPATFEDLLP